MSFVPYHIQLVVKGTINKATSDCQELNSWLYELVEKVGMQVAAGPISTYVNEPGNEGITGVIVLSTSHASIHVWDATNPMCFQFDLYSCKKFNPSTVIKHLDEKFALISYEWIVIDRNEEIKIVASGKS